MQSTNEVIEEIKKWDLKLQNDNNDYLYEIAFFKIFVKFELYLSEVFIEYSTGKKTKDGKELARKLNFRDERHLQRFLKNGNSSYIDYYEKIERCKLTKEIFEDNQDPFDYIFTSATYSGYVNYMKLIRNYIAHESNEAKVKYVRSVLNNKDFIEPYKHLLNFKKGTNKTNYSIYIEKIEEMVNILEYPLNYLNPVNTSIAPKEPENQNEAAVTEQ